MSVSILVGDVRDALRIFSSDSFQTIATSPPYFRMRDYGIVGQLGLEVDPFAYVVALVEVLRELRRVLRPDGILWLVLGDCFYGDSPLRPSSAGAFSSTWNPALSSGRGGSRRSARRCGPLKRKDLCLLPARVAIAAQEDGWWVRSEVIWHKPNPVPEGKVADRPTRSHELVYLLTKRARYRFEQDAVREPHVSRPQRRTGHAARSSFASERRAQPFAGLARDLPGPDGDPRGRNLRDVWTIPTRTTAGSHAAGFPEELVERCLRAGSRPGDLVLDPFLGSGTTALVAARLGRSAVGVELNPTYAAEAAERIERAGFPRPRLLWVRSRAHDG